MSTNDGMKQQSTDGIFRKKKVKNNNMFFKNYGLSFVPKFPVGIPLHHKM